MTIHAGQYLKSANKPNDVTVECENNGCNTSCRFYKGTKATVTDMYSPIHNQPYKYTEISHICERIADVGARRHDIYTRAMQASDNVPFDYGGNLTRYSAKCMEVFDAITAEYRCRPCPFFLPGDNGKV